MLHRDSRISTPTANTARLQKDLIIHPVRFPFKPRPTSFFDGHGVTEASRTNATEHARPGFLLGPPRKPRQSGHALWVGNLPCSTDIMKLKEHFSEAATGAIESVFWISKSKSAFVNYRTGESLLDAMNRFHDSRFEGVRLVCRVRKEEIPCPNPIMNSLRPGDVVKNHSSLTVQDSMEMVKDEEKSRELARGSETHITPPLENKAKKRFFIMKSLTREELESSVQTAHWMTQQHNETSLNEAFAV